MNRYGRFSPNKALLTLLMYAGLRMQETCAVGGGTFSYG